MQKSYKKLVLSITVVALSSMLAFAQDKAGYKDVVLDGKPAKLNIATGEITFVNPKDKKEPVKFDDFVAAKEKEVIQTEDKNSTAGLHVVQEGETLFDISKYYKVSLNKLKEENNLETTLISKGQVLRVKNFDTVKTSNANTESLTIEQLESKRETSQYHIVKKGETLFRLAKQYNLSLEALKRFNNLSSNIISEGQKLRVNNIEVVNTSKNSISDSIWVVAKGDTLYSIAKKNGMSVDQLTALNGLTSTVIFVGQKLRVN